MDQNKLLVFFFIILAACNNHKTNHSRTRQVDSLLTELDTMNYRLKQLDIESVLYIQDSLENKKKRVDNIEELKEIRTIQNHLNTLLERYDHIHREVIHTRNHLESLKMEMQSREMADTTLAKEIKKEEKIIIGLNKRINRHVEFLENRIQVIKKQYLKNE